MSPVFAICIVIAVLATIFIGIPLAINAISNMNTDRSRLSGSQKQELKELRATVRNIEILAARNKDINPELAAQVEDEIYKYKTKELG